MYGDNPNNTITCGWLEGSWCMVVVEWVDGSVGGWCQGLSESVGYSSLLNCLTMS